MTEDHIKTVVIDPPTENCSDDETYDDVRKECAEYYEPEERQTPMPSSWLS